MRGLNPEQNSTFLKIDGFILKALRAVTYVSMVCLIGIMLVAFFDVVGSKLHTAGLPIKGVPAANEIIQYLHIPMVYLAAAYVTLDRGHTKIDLLSARFPAVLQKIFNILGDLLGIGLCGIICWRGWIQMGKYISRHTMSSVSGTKFALWPFALIMVIGFALLAISFIWAIVRECVGYHPALPNETGGQTPDEIGEGGEG